MASRPVCRNFKTGYCKYGEGCKFLHTNSQQAKPNPFGFGSQNTSQFPHSNSQPQQQPNPFGFGVQNNNQSGSKPTQFKPGDNKWSRFSQINGGNSSAPKKQDSQAPAANHECTDPASCKRQISEDFEHEQPLWKLTCYGHSKYGPCDVSGDLSYEELRASAYDDTKRGTNLQLVIEKERTLLSSKLIEFENLLRNPYKPPQNSTFTTQNTLAGTSSNVFSQTIQNNGPPTVSSFSQLGTNFNAGFQMRPAAPNNAFAQVNQFQTSTQMSNAPQKNTFAFGNPGLLANQPSTQSVVSPFPATTTTFGNGFSNAATSPATTIFGNGFSNAATSPAATTNFGNAFPNSATSPFAGHTPSPTNVVPTSVPIIQLPQDPSSSSNKDNSIWLKEEWKRGEIPEEAPPAEVIY